MKHTYAKITAIGTYVPKKELTNSYFEKIVDTNDNWILQRTGIKKRHIIDKGETNLSMSLNSVDNLCKNYNKSIDDVDFIICATSTSEFTFPNLASQIQNSLQINNCGAIDVYSACAGFTYNLILADSLIRSGTYNKILAITSETLSRIVDYSDRKSCILFGDASSAVLIEGSSQIDESIINTCSGSDGEQGVNLYSGKVISTLNGKKINNNGKINQNGRAIYKWVVENIPHHIKILLEKSSVKKEEIDWFIPHSANQRIIENVCQGAQIPIEKTLSSIEQYGNTSSCTIPLAIEENLRLGKIAKGQKLLLYGFGGGMVHSGVIVNWTA